jgi:hypothetical protein
VGGWGVGGWVGGGGVGVGWGGGGVGGGGGWVGGGWGVGWGGWVGLNIWPESVAIARKQTWLSAFNRPSPPVAQVDPRKYVTKMKQANLKTHEWEMSASAGNARVMFSWKRNAANTLPGGRRGVQNWYAGNENEKRD